MPSETFQAKLEAMIRDVQRQRNIFSLRGSNAEAGSFDYLYKKLDECRHVLIISSISPIHVALCALSDLIYTARQLPHFSQGARAYLEIIEILLIDAEKDHEDETNNTEIQ